jgi:hypothetical protein
MTEKCIYCGSPIDADDIDAVQVGERVAAHLSCLREHEDDVTGPEEAA